MNTPKSPGISAALVFALIFGALIFLFPNGEAHEVLNGVYVGTAFVVFLVFHRVTFDTLLGRGEYRRAQRMALGLTLLWIAFNLRTLASILYRATNNSQWVLDLPLGALVTYIAIIAGWLQITSPGFGMHPGYIHGQSRTWIVFSFAVSLLIGFGVIWLQRASTLSGVLSSLAPFWG